MEKVTELVKSIKDGLTQASASHSDEIRVMKAMLNDETYKVDVYGKDGVEDTYCPAEDAQALVASIIQKGTKVTGAEASELAKNFEFGKSDAVIMVNISKEFTNTYLDTGRKLKLGNRDAKSIAMVQKDKPETTRPCPSRVGLDDQGQPIYKTMTTTIPAYKEVKVTSRPISSIKK